MFLYVFICFYMFLYVFICFYLFLFVFIVFYMFFICFYNIFNIFLIIFSYFLIFFSYFKYFKYLFWWFSQVVERAPCSNFFLNCFYNYLTFLACEVPDATAGGRSEIYVFNKNMTIFRKLALIKKLAQGPWPWGPLLVDNWFLYRFVDEVSFGKDFDDDE